MMTPGPLCWSGSLPTHPFPPPPLSLDTLCRCFEPTRSQTGGGEKAEGDVDNNTHPANHQHHHPSPRRKGRGRSMGGFRDASNTYYATTVCMLDVLY